jgi:hypothetical protein
MGIARNYRLDAELNTVTMKYYYRDSNYTLERMEIVNEHWD